MKSIKIEGARVHNLKGVSLEIPRGSFCVLCGPSGSGKSSFALDTLHAESRREFIDSLSVQARKFLRKVPRPEFDHIADLPPTIAVGRESGSRHPRSTLATITEIHDYLRILYARFGAVTCYKCGREIRSLSIPQILAEIMAFPDNTRLVLLSPNVRSGRAGECDSKEVLRTIFKNGFVRVRIDGIVYELEELLRDDISPPVDFKSPHNIETVIDRIVVRENVSGRLEESLKLAEKIGEGLLVVSHEKERKTGSGGNSIGAWEDVFYSTHHACPACGIDYPKLSPGMFSFNNRRGACPECEGTGIIETKTGGRETCSGCNGTRLRKEARAVVYSGKRIDETCALDIDRALDHFRNVIAVASQEQRPLLEQLVSRTEFIREIGLGYLTLDREAGGLSGGELRRLRIAAGLGGSLGGVCYILDEPSNGLHPADGRKLLDALRKLQRGGNTLIALEHDEAIMLEADFLVDFGPGAGEQGGYITAAGNPAELMADEKSLTGRYLSGAASIPVPKIRRPVDDKRLLSVEGCTEHNLKNVTARFPLGLFTCVTGLSGSGKSSLIRDTLVPAVDDYFRRKSIPDSGKNYREISGLEYIDKLIEIDATPLGRSSRSNPAVYTGLFGEIRKIFALTKGAKRAGYDPGCFSFNASGGRCERCRGAGTVKIEMHFLPDLESPCPDCVGKRFNSRTLEIRYKGLSIAEVLDLSVSDALVFFKNFPKISRILKSLDKVGLGYVTLSQPGSSLSGGESQRVKLAKELARPETGNTLYVLDEPSRGLHSHDIRKLLEILDGLLERGNTVIVIEHNLEFMKSADHIIDLGPGSGEQGGEILASGTPEEIAAIAGNKTGEFLKEKINAL